MAPVQKKELAPGDSTVVELIFSTKTSRGKVAKNARITSNDSSMASITIDFSGNIMPVPDTISTIRIAPEQMMFDKENKKFRINVQNHGGTAIKLSLAENPVDDIKTKIKNPDVKGGTDRDVEFGWNGKIPEYDITHVVTFDTGDLSVPRFSIPYIIKGVKGARPGTTPDHAASKATPAQQMQQAVQPQYRPGGPEANQQMPIKVRPDSTKSASPVPAAQWPPK